MKNTYLQLRNLIGQTVTAMVQPALSMFLHAGVCLHNDNVVTCKYATETVPHAIQCNRL